MNQPLIPLSQAQLNTLETCPLQFQKTYLEQLDSPLSVEIQDKLAWGNRFHLLMQQQELGLNIAALLEPEDELSKAIKALNKTIAQNYAKNPPIWREAEHLRTLAWKNYLLKVVYDLVIFRKNSAEIIDWKTYLKPTEPTQLAKNWQTRLYLYVLAETSNYQPQQISLTYWFVKLPQTPEKLTFTYNDSLHQKTKQDLRNLLNNLNFYWESFVKQGLDFPRSPACAQVCSAYFPCQNSPSSQSNQWLDLVEEIAEISL